MHGVSQALIFLSLLVASRISSANSIIWDRSASFVPDYCSSGNVTLPESKRLLRHLFCLPASPYSDLPAFYRSESLLPEMLSEAERISLLEEVNFRSLEWKETKVAARMLNGEFPANWYDTLFPLRRILPNIRFIRKMKSDIEVRKDPEAGSVGSAAVSLHYWTAVERCRITTIDFSSCVEAMDLLFRILDVRAPRTTGGILHRREWHQLLLQSASGVKSRSCLSELKSKLKEEAGTSDDYLLTQNLWALVLDSCDGDRSIALRVLGVYLGRNNSLEQMGFDLAAIAGRDPYLGAEDLKVLLLDLEFLNDWLPLLCECTVGGDLFRFLYPQNYRAKNLRYYHFYHRAYLADRLVKFGIKSDVASEAAFAFGYAYEALSDLSRYASAGAAAQDGPDFETFNDIFLSSQGALFGAKLPGYQNSFWLLEDRVPWKRLRSAVRSYQPEVKP